MATNEPAEGAPAEPAESAGAVAVAEVEAQGRAAMMAAMMAAITIDPFEPHLRFANRFRPFAQGSTRFADSMKPSIDVKVDKVLDLSKFGREFKGFYKPVRLKAAEEIKDEFEERRRNLEPQFILRNLGRVVKEIEPGAPLDFKRVRSAVKSLESPPDMSKLYAAPAFLPAMGHDHAREERKWRRYMLEEMDWNRYFSREIKEKIAGPLWAHDPDKNPAPAAPVPVPAAAADDGHEAPDVPTEEAAEPPEEFL